MPRVNPADVEAILDTSLDRSALTGHIAAATVLVDDIADAAPSTPTTRLEEIERRLAAHYASSQDHGTETDSRSGPSRSESYRDDRATHFKIAKSLDPTNVVATSQKPNATVSVPDTKRGG